MNRNGLTSKGWLQNWQWVSGVATSSINSASHPHGLFLLWDVNYSSNEAFASLRTLGHMDTHGFPLQGLLSWSYAFTHYWHCSLLLWPKRRFSCVSHSMIRNIFLLVFFRVSRPPSPVNCEVSLVMFQKCMCYYCLWFIKLPWKGTFVYFWDYIHYKNSHGVLRFS